MTLNGLSILGYQLYPDRLNVQFEGEPAQLPTAPFTIKDDTGNTLSTVTAFTVPLDKSVGYKKNFCIVNFGKPEVPAETTED
jgi:hypothetical protein